MGRALDLDRALAADATTASGAREASDEWLATHEPLLLCATPVASKTLKQNERVAALDFASSLSRPRRSSIQ